MGPETCKLTDDVGAVFAFCSLLALQNLKIKAIRESDVYRLILSIGMGSEIIGRDAQIGRAACRERVCQYVKIKVVAVSLIKNNTRAITSCDTYKLLTIQLYNTRQTTN